jgi:hypothetical protein
LKFWRKTVSDEAEIDRVELLFEIVRGKAMCHIATSLLDDLGGGGLRDDGLVSDDMLYGVAGIILSVTRTLSLAETFVGSMEASQDTTRKQPPSAE